MDEKSNVEFHLANSVSDDMQTINTNEITKLDVSDEDDQDYGQNSTKNKKKKTKDDDADLINIAKGLSAKQKKLTFMRLLQQAYPDKHILAIGIFFTFLGSITYLVTPVLMGAMLDSVSSDNQVEIKGPTIIFCELSPMGCDTERDLLKTAVSTLFIVSLFGAVFSFFKWFCLEMTGERVVARLRKKLFASIISQEIGMFDVTKTGELVNRLSADTTILKSACTFEVAQTLQAGVQVILSLIYVFWLSWSLTLIMLSILPVCIVVGYFYGLYYRKQSKINQERLADATTVATESIALIRTVKSFSQESYQETKYNDAIHLSYKQGVLMAFASGIWMGFFNIMANVGIGAVLWYGAMQVLNGSMNPGDLATYVLLTIQIGFSFGRFISLYTTIMRALGASERVFQLIDRDTAIPIVGGNKQNNLKGLVEIKNVSFAYPSRTEMKVLKDLTLTVYPGKVISLVGESGGGKSTVAKLVMRFYDPTDGTIFIDGKDLKEYDLKWLHKQIGFVSQEPVLFANTISENIIYGVSNNENGKEIKVPMDKIVSAAKQANAHDFIMSFPDKYETVVGERGIRLSGGQKQRIAIARAILMDPKILLLDEATSALDAESEYLVQQALDRIMIGRSVLVIAHRLSTVKNAHKVVVIEKGNVVETGTHQELLQKTDGSYSKLVKRQLFTD